jgi:hypothetical protein
MAQVVWRSLLGNQYICIYTATSLVLWHKLFRAPLLGNQYICIYTFNSKISSLRNQEEPCWQNSYQVGKTSSPITPLMRFPNVSVWTVRALAFADFGCRWLSQLWPVTRFGPELENACGHDTGGIRVLDWCGIDNTGLYATRVIPDGSRFC